MTLEITIELFSLDKMGKEIEQGILVSVWQKDILSRINVSILVRKLFTNNKTNPNLSSHLYWSQTEPFSLWRLNQNIANWTLKKRQKEGVKCAKLYSKFNSASLLTFSWEERQTRGSVLLGKPERGKEQEKVGMTVILSLSKLLAME